MPTKGSYSFLIHARDFFRLKKNPRLFLEKQVSDNKILAIDRDLKQVRIDFFSEHFESINTMHQYLQSLRWKDALHHQLKETLRIEAKYLNLIHEESKSQAAAFQEQKNDTPAGIRENRELTNSGLILSLGPIVFFAEFDLLRWDSKGLCDAYLFSSIAKVRDSYAGQAALSQFIFQSNSLPINNVFLRMPEKTSRDGAFENVSLGRKMKYHKKTFQKDLENIRNTAEGMINSLSLEDLYDHTFFPPNEIDSDKSRDTDQFSFPGLSESKEREIDSLDSLFRGAGVIQKLKEQNIKSLLDRNLEDPQISRLLSPKHRIQINTVRERSVHLDKKSLSQYLSQIKEPVFSLDFESIHEVLPEAQGVKAWEHYPFMYSCALIKGNGEKNQQISDDPFGIEPLERSLSIETVTGPLGSSITDFYYTKLVTLMPQSSAWKDLANQFLEDFSPAGSILVYNAQFEKAMINRLARWLPEREDEFRELLKRIVDLQEVFFNFWFYDHRQRGKISLKNILPLVSDFDHFDGEIQDGGFASISYYYLRHPKYLERLDFSLAHLQDSKQFVRDLLEYSALDAYGLLSIYRHLQQLCVN